MSSCWYLLPLKLRFSWLLVCWVRLDSITGCFECRVLKSGSYQISFSPTCTWSGSPPLPTLLVWAQMCTYSPGPWRCPSCRPGARGCVRPGWYCAAEPGSRSLGCMDATRLRTGSSGTLHTTEESLPVPPFPPTPHTSLRTCSRWEGCCRLKSAGWGPCLPGARVHREHGSEALCRWPPFAWAPRPSLSSWVFLGCGCSSTEAGRYRKKERTRSAASH